MVGQAVQRAVARAGLQWKLLTPSKDEVDLRDGKAVQQVLKRASVDTVIHCAARVGGIQANISDPVGFLADNALINVNVVEAAYKTGVAKLINLGSSCMYPKDYRSPLREDDLLAAPLEPTNEGYALSKLIGAKLCEYISQAGEYLYRTVIPCNLFGPGDDFSQERSHLIAAIIVKVDRALETGSSTLEVWGDGESRREFLFVEDLADFLVSVASRLQELPTYVNVGYGVDYSVNEYYEMVAEAMGFRGDLVHDLNRATGMRRKLLDSTRAARLGWQPRTGILEGIHRTVEYYKERVVR